MQVSEVIIIIKASLPALKLGSRNQLIHIKSASKMIYLPQSHLSLEHSSTVRRQPKGREEMSEAKV